MSLVWRWCEAAAGGRAPGPFGPKIFDRTGGLTPPARAASSPGLACDRADQRGGASVSTGVPRWVTADDGWSRKPEKGRTSAIKSKNPCGG